MPWTSPSTSRVAKRDARQQWVRRRPRYWLTGPTTAVPRGSGACLTGTVEAALLRPDTPLSTSSVTTYPSSARSLYRYTNGCRRRTSSASLTRWSVWLWCHGSSSKYQHPTSRIIWSCWCDIKYPARACRRVLQSYDPITLDTRAMC